MVPFPVVPSQHNFFAGGSSPQQLPDLGGTSATVLLATSNGSILMKSDRGGVRGVASSPSSWDGCWVKVK